MSERDRIRAINAQRILRDELFVEAWERAEGQILQKWRNGVHTPAEREACYLELKALDRVKSFLTDLMTFGKDRSDGS